MGKFKVGDKVLRVSGVVDLVTHITGIEKGGIYTVESVSKGMLTLVESFHQGFTFPGTHFTLVDEQDDPLPPVPENVRYNDEYPDHSVYKQTWLDVKQDRNQIYIKTGQYGESKGVGMVLSPDAVLQLAHDLRRLAMKIKREDKY